MLLAVSFLFGCSTPSIQRLEECLTDPLNDELHCDGESIKWKDTYPGEYICHPVDKHEDYMWGCR